LTIAEIDNINSELYTKSINENGLDVEKYENKESQSDNVDTISNTLSTTVSSPVSSLSPTSPIIYEAASNNARPMEASSVKSGHSMRESVMEDSRIGKNKKMNEKIRKNSSGSSRIMSNSSWEVIDRDVDEESKDTDMHADRRTSTLKVYNIPIEVDENNKSILQPSYLHTVNESSDKMLSEKGTPSVRANKWNGYNTPGMQVGGKNGFGSETFLNNFSPKNVRIIPITQETSLTKRVILMDQHPGNKTLTFNKKQDMQPSELGSSFTRECVSVPLKVSTFKNKNESNVEDDPIEPTEKHLPEQTLESTALDQKQAHSADEKSRNDKGTMNDKEYVKRTVPINVQKTAYQKDGKSRETTSRISKEETAIPTKLPFGKQSQLNKTIPSCEVRKENLHDATKKNTSISDIHNQLEEARQKLEQQMEKINTDNPSMKTVTHRSKSAGPESKSRPKGSTARYNFKRERSIEDIDKDIETIWKELQDLDRLPHRDRRKSSDSIHSEHPLADQNLVIPSWKRKSPAETKMEILPTSFQLSEGTSKSKYPRTIWDNPSQSNENDRFPPESNIKPTQPVPEPVNVSSRPSRSPTKARSANQRSVTLLGRSQSAPRQEVSWPECYNSFQKLQEKVKTESSSKGTPYLKSCLKLESRSSSLGRSIRPDSKASSRGGSPAKQSVIFKQPIIGCSTREKDVDKSTKESTPILVRVKTQGNEKISVPIIQTVQKEKTSSENYDLELLKSSTRRVPVHIEKEKVSLEEVKGLVKIEAPLATEEACFACDACTQTELGDKREACHLM